MENEIESEDEDEHKHKHYTHARRQERIKLSAVINIIPQIIHNVR